MFLRKLLVFCLNSSTLYLITKVCGRNHVLVYDENTLFQQRMSFLISKAGTFLRYSNSGRLPVKTGSNYHLAGSVDVKMSGRSRFKKTFVVKWLFYLAFWNSYRLLSLWKWRLICCVKSYNYSQWRVFPHVLNKIVYIRLKWNQKVFSKEEKTGCKTYFKQWKKIKI